MGLDKLDMGMSESNNKLKSLLGDKRRKASNLAWINLQRNESLLGKKSRQKSINFLLRRNARLWRCMGKNPCDERKV